MYWYGVVNEVNVTNMVEV